MPSESPRPARRRLATVTGAAALVALGATLLLRRPDRGAMVVLTLPQGAQRMQAAPDFSTARLSGGDEALKPLATGADLKCAPDDQFYEDRLLKNIPGQPYQLWRMDQDAKACPVDATPIPMPLYSREWATRFGTDSCMCHRPGDPPGP